MFFFKKNIYKVFNIIFLFVFALLVTESALAGIYKAGTNGDYATIQLAIDAAIASPSSNEIRVRPGTYSENISITSTSDIGTLNITGGWDDTFSTRDLDYTLTTIDGNGTGRVCFISVQSGGSLDLTLDGFTLQDGSLFTYGSGICISVYGTSQITINNNRILNNVSSGSGSIRGGGIRAYMDPSGVATLDITNNLIKGNSITSTENSCAGAGIALTFFDGSVFNITGNVIEDNSLTPSPGFSAEGTGMQIQKYGSGTCDISNNIIRNNTATGTGNRNGIGGYIYITGSSTITLARNQWLNNVNNGGNAGSDLYIDDWDISTIIIKDSLIAGAVHDGLHYVGAGQSFSMTNLTITDNNGYGLTGGIPASVSLYNTIIYNNGTNDDTSPGDKGNNLIGVDPGFVDQAGQNYRLSPGSAAINAGTNSPTGGLGVLDLDGNTRISQSTVDIGAYEFKPACNPGVMLLLLN